MKQKYACPLCGHAAAQNGWYINFDGSFIRCGNPACRPNQENGGIGLWAANPEDAKTIEDSLFDENGNPLDS